MQMMGDLGGQMMFAESMWGKGSGIWGGKGGCCGGWGGGMGMGMVQPGLTGEIRYDAPMHAQMAVQMLNGSMLKGAQLTVGVDFQSSDGSKLWVAGVPPGTSWQELKDHFRYVGQVAFAAVK